MLIPVVFILIHGCTPTRIKMTLEDQIDLNNRQLRISAVHYEPSDLFILTPVEEAMAGGGCIGGLIGICIDSVTRVSKSKNIVIENSVDPVLRIKNRVISRINEKQGINVQSMNRALEDDFPDELRRKISGKWLLDFKTVKWRLQYYQWSWSKYYIEYIVRARIIRLTDGKIVWQGVYSFEGDDPADSRATLDELAVNNGELIKKEFNKIADICTDELLSQLYEK